MSFTCPDCGRTSHHPKDEQFSYCGNCHEFKDANREDEFDHPNGPWRDGRVWVLSDKCSTCIFRPHNLMQLAPGRVAGMIEACLREDTVIPCHQTLDGPRSICRGFYDTYGPEINAIRFARALDFIAYDDPPETH
jgi:hypothetical protein